MSNSKTSGNPLLDMWMKGYEQFSSTPDEAANTAGTEAAEAAATYYTKSNQAWEQCADHFNNWLNAAGNRLATAVAKPQDNATDNSTNSLPYMLNPRTFLQSGFAQLQQVFIKLADYPDFADIGTLEKKLLRTGSDWLALNAAIDEYQVIVASAWMRAFASFSAAVATIKTRDKLSSKALLDLWLKIADAELVGTLRSDEFLAAQKKLFSAGTAYKLRHREFAELWCESHMIPTLSEVDDMHKLIYELRREVRDLSKVVAQLKVGKIQGLPAAKNTKAKVTRAKNIPPASKAVVKKAPAKDASRIIKQNKKPVGKAKRSSAAPQVKSEGKLKLRRTRSRSRL